LKRIITPWLLPTWTAIVLLAALTGCYGLPAATESAVKTGIAVDRGHMNDTALPQSTRDIAQDNHDLLWQILYGAGSVKGLPADVRARVDARAGVSPTTTATAGGK